jgi:hypothetical protein
MTFGTSAVTDQPDPARCSICAPAQLVKVRRRYFAGRNGGENQVVVTVLLTLCSFPFVTFTTVPGSMSKFCCTIRTVPVCRWPHRASTQSDLTDLRGGGRRVVAVDDSIAEPEIGLSVTSSVSSDFGSIDDIAGSEIDVTHYSS